MISGRSPYRANASGSVRATRRNSGSPRETKVPPGFASRTLSSVVRPVHHHDPEGIDTIT